MILSGRMVFYHKTIPLDSRIYIDYENKNVDFEYPKRPTKWEVFKTVYCAGMLWWFKKLVKLHKYVILPFAIAVLIFFIVDGLTNPTTTVDMVEQLKMLGLFFGSFIGLMSFMMGPPLIFVARYYMDPINISKIIPEINAESASERYVSVFTKTNSNKIKIPIFSNVLMDYWLEGDFKNKIKTVEVKELQNVKKYKYKKGKLGKEKPQVDLWEVIFTFKSEPVNGKLIVHYV